MPDHVPSIAAARLAIQEQLRVLSGRRRLASQRQRRMQAAANRQWKLPPDVVDTALVIYCGAEYDVRPTCNFLQRVARKRRWQVLPEEALTAVVEQLFLQVDLDRLVLLLSGTCQSDARAHATARKWISEWKLVCWIEHVNSRGVAPSTCQLLQKAKSFGCCLPSGPREWLKGRPGPRVRVWAARFRSRWNGRIGKVRGIEKLPTSETHSKVSMLLFF